ncbi:MAG: sulfotransferase family 2 domain-containing protein [Candidatus Pacebacteria bacterium]|nr:sulfotransferase family 2 domain-containing protein [Candidatus Paceibacterota bacterium]
MKNLKEKIDTKETFLLSVHIPKTGGTTFGKILADSFGDSFLYVYPCENDASRFVIHHTLQGIHDMIHESKGILIEDVIAYIKENNIYAIHGHFEKEITWHMLRKLDSHFFHITTLAFVRDPIDRVMSELDHYKVHWGINEITDDHYIRSQNMLSRSIDISFPDLIICRTEQFHKDVQNLGFHWNGISENITPIKGLHNEEKIRSYNTQDVELYRDLL